MNHIVIGTDGSPGAQAAVSEGLELARLLGADVTFVAVRHGISILGDPYYQRKLTEQLAHARAAVDDALAVAAEEGVKAEYEICEGDAADEIIRTARYHEAGLIVVGSRGLGAFAGALLGSVSQKLVQHSPIPVVVVKEREPASVEPELSHR